MAFSSSGRSRRLNTTRCPAGRVVVGAENNAEWVPSVYGTSRSASVTAGGVPSARSAAARPASSGAGRAQVRRSELIPAWW